MESVYCLCATYQLYLFRVVLEGHDPVTDKAAAEYTHRGLHRGTNNTMSTNENTIWLEAAQENLEEACKQADWSLARAVIADVEDQGFDASYLRRYMNQAMAQADDVSPLEGVEFNGEVFTKNGEVIEEEVY